MLAFPHQTKYIRILNKERIWASRLIDHILIDVTPARSIISDNGSTKRQKPKYHYKYSG